MSEHHADGVSYIEVAGLRSFRCQTWRATLSVSFCARRWREAQSARGIRAEELNLCRQCQIGAAHAGEPVLPRAENFGNNVCVRQMHCISCWNRGREWVRGKNARGNTPVKALAELRYLTLAVVLDPGQPTERTVEFTDIAIDEEELRLTIGRVHEGRIELLGLVPHGTHSPWRPAALGGLKAVVTPPTEATGAPRQAPAPEAPVARQSAAVGRLRLAAFGTSCLAGLRLAPFSGASRRALTSGRFPLAA